MTRDARDAILLLLGSALFLALCIAFAVWMHVLSCRARWEGWNTQWGPLSGCRVEVGFRYVPEQNVREIQP